MPVDDDGLTPKEKLPIYQKHANLKDKWISASRAVKKYKIPRSTLFQWNYLIGPILLKTKQQGNLILFNEADVAYCAEVHKKHAVKGRPTFNADGTPFTPLPKDLTQR